MLQPQIFYGLPVYGYTPTIIYPVYFMPCYGYSPLMIPPPPLTVYQIPTRQICNEMTSGYSSEPMLQANPSSEDQDTSPKFGPDNDDIFSDILDADDPIFTRDTDADHEFFLSRLASIPTNATPVEDTSALSSDSSDNHIPCVTTSHHDRLAESNAPITTIEPECMIQNQKVVNSTLSIHSQLSKQTIQDYRCVLAVILASYKSSRGRREILDKLCPDELQSLLDQVEYEEGNKNEPFTFAFEGYTFKNNRFNPPENDA